MSGRFIKSRPGSAMSRGARPAPISLAQISALFGGLLFAYLISWGLFTPVRETAFLAAVAIAIVATITASRVYLQLPLAAFIAFCSCYALASWFHALPTAWTDYYDRTAVIRQYMWVPLIPLFVTAFSQFIRRYEHVFWKYPKTIVAVLFLWTRACSLYLTEPDEWFNNATLYGVNNVTMPVISLWLLIILTTRDTAKKLLLLVPLLVLATSATNFLTVIFAALVVAFGHPRRMAVAMALAIIAMLFTAPFFFQEFSALDPNSGIRAYFWRDAIDAIVQSHGIGVGYGTEYITNYFQALTGSRWTVVGEGDAGRMYLSTHSSFYDVAMRTGVVGAVLLLAWINDLFKVGLRCSKREFAVYYCLLAQVLLATAFNPGMVSVNAFLGVCFALSIMNVRSGPRPQSRRFVRIARPAGGAEGGDAREFGYAYGSRAGAARGHERQGR